MTFEEFLDAVTAQCAVHGREGLHAVDDFGARQLGFVSPEGRFMVSLGEVRRYFLGGGPLRLVEVQRPYMRWGRPHVPSLFARYGMAISTALARGEVAYRVDRRRRGSA